MTQQLGWTQTHPVAAQPEDVLMPSDQINLVHNLKYIYIYIDGCLLRVNLEYLNQARIKASLLLVFSGLPVLTVLAVVQ